jgi:TrmH family RNA methyltransferase
VLTGALDFFREIDFQFAFERRNFVGESLENPILHKEIDFSTVCYAHFRDDAPVKTISSRQNALVRAYRDLARKPDPSGRRLLLDGAHLVREAHAARLSFESVVIAHSHLNRATEEHVLAQSLDRAGVDVASAGDSVFAALSPVRTPSGIVAIALRQPTTMPEILAQARLFLVVVVDVQDPGNLGALVRISEAGGVTGMIVAGDSANPFSWKAVRGSMGSVLRLPVTRESTDVVLQELQKSRTKIIAAVPRDGRHPDAVDWCGRSALLLGGEGQGLDAGIIAATDERVTIPMKPPVESLNVAASAAILIYAARRSRQ